jgi:hypothetical protein
VQVAALAVVAAVLEAAEVAEDAPVESQASKSVGEKRTHKALGVFEGLVFFRRPEPIPRNRHTVLSKSRNSYALPFLFLPVPPPYDMLTLFCEPHAAFATMWEE